MLDRRRLAAPLCAQAAAFVAVLVIGGFTSHSSPKAAPSSGSGQTAGPTATASASSASSKGAALKLTVRVTKDGEGLPLPGSQVTVLQDGTLASVTTGTLNSALEFAANVPAGQYQVCINPPIGWDSRIRTTHVLADWICSPADLRTSPQLVTFSLTSQVPQVSP